MRLYLAVAVLLLALVAFTDAQDETFEQKVQRFGGQVVDGVKKAAEDAGSAIQDVHNSEWATNVRGFFSRLGERIKNGLTGATN